MNTNQTTSIPTRVASKRITMIRTRRAWIWVFFFLTAVSAQEEQVKVSDGYRWHLPEWVKETPNAGWAWCSPWTAQQWQSMYPLNAPDDEVYFNRYRFLVWADVHTGPGVFDWSAVDNWVAEITDVPHMGFAFFPVVYARMLDGDRGIYTGDRYAVPHWLETDGYDGKKVRFYPGTGEPTGWETESGYLPALTEFISTLGQRYGNHPRFSYIDIRAIDAVYGEGQLQGRANKQKIDDLQDNYGYSPKAYESFMNAMFDMYAEVFSGREHKCVIQIFDVGAAGPPGYYEGVFERVWHYGLGKGFGGRDGQVENYMRYLNLGYGLCNNPENDHFMVFEDTYPVFRAWEDDPEHGPVWMTENEELGKDHKYGPKEYGSLYWFASCLRALQMRRSHIGISSGIMMQDSAFSRYVQLSLGKTRRTSPDAWCWLRQANNWAWTSNYPSDTAVLGTDRSAPEGGYLNTNNGYPKEFDFLNWERGKLTFKNFERWLRQYDVSPDGMTEPAEPMEITTSDWSEAEGHDPGKLYGQGHANPSGGVEYWARRTDHLSGNNAVYFRIEPKWYRSYRGPVTILVTFKNVNESTWRLEYDDVDNIRKTIASPAASTIDEWQTAAFHADGLSASGGFAGNNDFRLLRTSGGDLIVHLVRIVMDQERAHPSATMNITRPAQTVIAEPADPGLQYELEVFDLRGRRLYGAFVPGTLPGNTRTVDSAARGFFVVKQEENALPSMRIGVLDRTN